MKRVFADTSFFLEVVQPSSPRRRLMVQKLQSLTTQMITSEFVLIELANALSDPRDKALVRQIIDLLRNNPTVVITPCSSEWVAKGWKLFSSHSDKGWSLTDCISFAVMRSMRLSDALTTDHHFEQAGFIVLLK